MLEIRDVQVQKKGNLICHVEQLTVDRGERLAIVGPNGCGKTTLLRLISGLDDDYTGACRVDVARVERVYVHQAPYFFNGSVLFNAIYGLAAHKLPRAEQMAKGHAWLSRFRLNAHAKRRPSGLSGGERRRLALARAFALQPQLLLLDEPFADLDSAGVDDVARAIEDSPNVTVIMTSPRTLPDHLSTRLFQLTD